MKKYDSLRDDQYFFFCVPEDPTSYTFPNLEPSRYSLGQSKEKADF